MSKMSFFPRSIYADQGFTPLFRLLEDFDSYKAGSSRGCRVALPNFQPKFDVRETEDTYELHGELAGLNKNDVHIEFSDPQTMVICGRIERSYTSGGAPEFDSTKSGGSVTGSGETSQSHRATVEDDDEEYHSVAPMSEGEAPNKEAPKKQSPNDRAKYWLSERSIGAFSRSFTFPTHVNQDSVSATLKDGILSVTVPKHKKTQNYRVTID